MRRVLYRDEPFFYRVKREVDVFHDVRRVVTVFRKRTGLFALIRPYVNLGEGLVGEATIPAALERVLKGIVAAENPEPPLLIECSPEIEELYKL